MIQRYGAYFLCKLFRPIFHCHYLLIISICYVYIVDKRRKGWELLNTSGLKGKNYDDNKKGK